MRDNGAKPGPSGSHSRGDRPVNKTLYSSPSFSVFNSGLTECIYVVCLALY